MSKITLTATHLKEEIPFLEKEHIPFKVLEEDKKFVRIEIDFSEPTFLTAYGMKGRKVYENEIPSQ
jgi:hypothetical protein